MFRLIPDEEPSLKRRNRVYRLGSESTHFLKDFKARLHSMRRDIWCISCQMSGSLKVSISDIFAMTN